jgi:chromosome segregation protein
MTYIKEVELDNFKSFAGHTKFVFIKGFNIIAGANGSGKSNLIDALMFVLGATSKKEMRSELLTDLIFNGGKIQKPSEFAKVNIVLDNSDKTFSAYEEGEVSISRKIDESGKSVFRINGKASTREEILNILSIIKVNQDSFNIIPQGKIAEIAGSSPEQRLQIINDLSGISVFEEKKSKALNEMKKVQENIETAETVLKEKKQLMAQLEREKGRAEEFKNLSAEVAILQSKLVTIKKIRVSESRNDIIKRINELENKNVGFSQKKTDLTKRLTDIKHEINEINTKTESAGEKEIIEAENLSKSLDLELSKLRIVATTDKEQIDKLSVSISDLDKNIKEISSSAEKETEETITIKNKIYQLSAKRREFTEATAKAERYFKEKSEMEHRLSEISNRIYEYRLALANYPKSAELQSKLSALNQERSRLESEIKEMTFSYSKEKIVVDKLKADIRREADQLYILKEKLLTQKTLLTTKNRAVEAADRLKKEISGVYGTINELFVVKEERHKSAISNSLGRRGDFIVVKDEHVATECINKLKKERLGRYNFIPLNKIVQMGIGARPELPFVIDYTINLVRFDTKFSLAMQFAFGDTLLVDSFENAKTAINRYRMVTLDGTILEKSGVISGGSHENLDFSSISNNYKEINERIIIHSKIKENYENALPEKEATVTFLLSKIKSYEKDLEDILIKINSITKELSNFQGTESDILNAINTAESEKADTEKKLKDLDRDKFEKVNYKKDIEMLDKQLNDLQIRLGTTINNLEHVFKSGLENLQKRRSELEKEKIKFEKEVIDIENKINDNQKKLEAVFTDLNKKSAAIVALREKRGELNKEAIGIEESLGEVNASERATYDALNRLKIEEAGLNVKLETVEEEFNKYFVRGTVLNEEDTAEELSKKLDSSKKKVDSFGPINELALETFNNVSSEYTEGSDKLIKLNEERERILAVIKDIENKKLETFMKTLLDINTILSNVFNSITGGKAEMVPDNQQDIFGGGLDIKIELPNKKIHNIRGLSGGEISILSIAILMSISKYIDVPFYVLDEVDAALDSVNSAKFSSLVKAYSETTQFIVITHNETTLLNADVIYGVTMSESGISRIVGVKPPKEVSRATG